MTKWKALKLSLDYISYGWEGGEGYKPLTPRWLGVLMNIAEQAEEAGWDSKMLQIRLDDGRF